MEPVLVRPGPRAAGPPGRRARRGPPGRGRKLAVPADDVVRAARPGPALQQVPRLGAPRAPTVRPGLGRGPPAAPPPPRPVRRPPRHPARPVQRPGRSRPGRRAGPRPGRLGTRPGPVDLTGPPPGRPAGLAKWGRK